MPNRVTQGPTTTAGKGSAEEKKHNQAITPGHEHGQKMTPKTERGAEHRRRRPDSQGN